MIDSQSSFVICQVGNGWIVEFPRAVDTPQLRKSQAAYLDAFSKVVEKMDRDPLLSSLITEDDENEADKPGEAVVRVGAGNLERDRNIFVFPTFQDVLLFLNHEITE